jgi:hypothetical protein
MSSEELLAWPNACVVAVDGRVPIKHAFDGAGIGAHARPSSRCESPAQDRVHTRQARDRLRECTEATRPIRACGRCTRGRHTRVVAWPMIQAARLVSKAAADAARIADGVTYHTLHSAATRTCSQGQRLVTARGNQTTLDRLETRRRASRQAPRSTPQRHNPRPRARLLGLLIARLVGRPQRHDEPVRLCPRNHATSCS